MTEKQIIKELSRFLEMLEDEDGGIYLDRDESIVLRIVLRNAREIVTRASNTVEVVTRCKDCDVPHNEWTGCPNLRGLVTPPDFYCALAEPKTKGGEG